jgi:hypothetical protein
VTAIKKVLCAIDLTKTSRNAFVAKDPKSPVLATVQVGIEPELIAEGYFSTD